MTTQLSVNVPNDVKDPVLRRVVARLLEEGAINKNNISKVVFDLNSLSKSITLEFNQIRDEIPGLATEEVPGIVELADDVEVDRGRETNKVITAAQLRRKLVDKAYILRLSYRGIWTLNNDYVLGETVSLDGSWFICIKNNTATNSNKPDPTDLYHTIWSVISAKGDKGDPGTGTGVATPDASTTVKGKIEIATSFEAASGIDTSRAMTPKLVKDRIDTAISSLPPDTTLTKEQVQDIVGAMFSGIAIYNDLHGTINFSLPSSSASLKGVIEIATNAESDGGTDNTRAITPYQLKRRIDTAIAALPSDKSLTQEEVEDIVGGMFSGYATYNDSTGKIIIAIPNASALVNGLITLATSSEAVAGTNNQLAMTPKLVKDRIDAAIGGLPTTTVPDASTTVKGKIEIATGSEATTGTDTSRAMTPKLVKDRIDAAVSSLSSGTALTTEQVQDIVGAMFSGIAFYDDLNDKITITLPSATTTVKGITEIATTLEGLSGVNRTKLMTPYLVKQVTDSLLTNFPYASTTVFGILELANNTEADEGKDTVRAMTPYLVKRRIDAFPSASTVRQGKIEIATNPEALLGADDTRAMTPKKTKYVLDEAVKGIQFPNVLKEQVQDYAGEMFSGIATYDDANNKIDFVLPSSTETIKGLIEIATNVEGTQGTDSSRAITPKILKYVLDNYAFPRLTNEQVQDIVGAMFSGIASYDDTNNVINITIPNASTTAKGIIEIATNTEADAGTSNLRAITPFLLKRRIDAAIAALPSDKTLTQEEVQDIVGKMFSGIASYNDSAGTINFSLPSSSASLKGVIEIATNVESDGGTDNTRAITPYQLKRRVDAAVSGLPTTTVPDASTTVKGKIEIATGSEASTGTDTLRAMTPKLVKDRIDAAVSGLPTTTVPDASTTVKGKIEIATNVETDGGIDNTRAITPFLLKRTENSIVSRLSSRSRGVDGFPGNFGLSDDYITINRYTTTNLALSQWRVYEPQNTLVGFSESALQLADRFEIRIENTSKANYFRNKILAGKFLVIADQTNTDNRFVDFEIINYRSLNSLSVGSWFWIDVKHRERGTDIKNWLATGGNSYLEIVIPKTLREVISDQLVDASTAVKGIIEIATDSESITATDNTKAITPFLLKRRVDAAVSGLPTTTVPDASTTVKGKIEIATGSEATTGTDTSRAMTPKLVKDRIDAAISSLPPDTTLTKEQVQDIVGAMFSGIASYNDGAGTIVITLPNATTTSKGVMELSSTAKVDAGSDNTTAITPWQLNRKLKDLSSILRNVYRGVWTLNNVYKVGETVSLDGSWFICIQANTATNSNKPDPTVLYHTIWRVIAAKGDKGEPGTGTGTGTTPDASTTVKGKIEIATGSEASTGTDTLRAMTPKLVKDRIDAAVSGLTTGTVPDASTTVKGKIEIATGSEASTGTDTLRAMTPKLVKDRIDAAVSGLTTGSIPDASTTVKGKIEIATGSEASTGTDTLRAMTPKLVKDRIDAAVSGLTTGSIPDASTTVKGKIEIATSAEAGLGTDTSRAMTPKLVADQIIEWNKYKAKLIQLVEPAVPGVDGFPGNQGFLNTRSSSGNSAINKRKGCALVQQISSSSNLSGYGWSLQNNSGHYVTTMTESALKNVTRVDINLTNGRINHVAYPGFYLIDDEEILKIIAGFTKSYNFYDDLENGYFRTKNYINYKFLTPTVSVGDFITFADVQNYNNRFVDFKITGFKQVTSANDLLEGVDFWLNVEYKESGSDLSNWKPRTQQYKVGATNQSGSYIEYTLYANLMWIGSVNTGKTIWGKRNELLKLV